MKIILARTVTADGWDDTDVFTDDGSITICTIEDCNGVTTTETLYLLRVYGAKKPRFFKSYKLAVKFAIAEIVRIEDSLRPSALDVRYLINGVEFNL